MDATDVPDIPHPQRRFTLNGEPVEWELLCCLGVLDDDQLIKAWDISPGEELRLDGGGPGYLLKRIE